MFVREGVPHFEWGLLAVLLIRCDVDQEYRYVYNLRLAGVRETGRGEDRPRFRHYYPPSVLVSAALSRGRCRYDL